MRFDPHCFSCLSKSMSGHLPPARICPFEKLHPSLLVQDDEYFMKLAYNQAS